VLERELARRLEQAAARPQPDRQDRSVAPLQRRLVVLFVGFEPISEWGRSPLLRSLLQHAGPQSGLTLIFSGEREADEPSRVDVRDQLMEPICSRSRARGADRRVVGRGDAYPRLSGLRRADRPAAGTAAPERRTRQVLARIVSLTEMVLGGDPLTADITGRWVLRKTNGCCGCRSATTRR